MKGKLCVVLRLSKHDVEYYADSLDKLVGKSSVINKAQAYELATQWLASVDMNMKAVNQLKWTVHQLHYRARGATNYVTLPLFYVDFGNIHYPAKNNLKAFDEPRVSVEILGTTKQLQDLTIQDLSLSSRPTMLVTNALDLVGKPNPPIKELGPAPMVHTNLSPP